MTDNTVNYAQLGELVAVGQQLVDEIKGGALSVVQQGFDEKVAAFDAELSALKLSGTVEDINGQPRYVYDIKMNGDKDTFYPVYFLLPSVGTTKIEISRSFNWDAGGASDFNTSHVGSALVSLVGNSYPWHGSANFLRTVVNKQAFRQTVSNVGFRAYALAVKKDLSGDVTSYNQSGKTFNVMTRSSFHLRGGRLSYQIVTNTPILFSTPDDGEIITSHAGNNVEWLAKTISVADVVSGDSENNHGVNFNSYLVSINNEFDW